MKPTGNLCVICGHDSAMHCFHAHADGSACCSGCTPGRCPGALAEAEALLDRTPGLRENLHAAIDEWRAGTLQTVDAATARERIEQRIRDRQSLRARMAEGAQSAPASPADAAYFSEVRSSIEAAGDERTCKQCGDQVAYLSTDDLCDGCVEAASATGGPWQIQGPTRCPMCDEPTNAAPEPWCIGKDNHDEWQP